MCPPDDRRRRLPPREMRADFPALYAMLEIELGRRPDWSVAEVMTGRRDEAPAEQELPLLAGAGG